MNGSYVIVQSVFISPYFNLKGGSTGVFCHCTTLIPPPAFTELYPGYYGTVGVFCAQ
ncbi:hypothetical protein BSM4216_3723 [Bacillus smithii]|nr:hypothetical protein BSM4216_3723 [Bacillus smithii]